jgi:hypothetical protein
MDRQRHCMASVYECMHELRAGTIISSKLSIRIKIIFLYLVEERIREKRNVFSCKSQI